MRLGRLATGLPPRVQWYLRGEKNRRNLHGLHSPGTLLTSLVPKGCLAVDVGANSGVYSYWISQSAREVFAFEPNPEIFSYLSRAVPPKVTAFNLALSDAPGEALLGVPSAGDGEASLLQEPHGSVRTFPVRCRTLDSFQLSDVGFVKVDVEGFELQVLMGGRHTIERNRPIIFIELEERHRNGAVSTVSDFLLQEMSYDHGLFLKRGALSPLSEFDAERDQLSLDDNHMSPDYVSNFLFVP